MNRTIAARALVAAAFAACAAGAHAARSSVAYTPSLSYDQAYLVDWNTTRHTAHVVVNTGESDASYTDDGTQRIVTLTTPLTVDGDYFDSCGNDVPQSTTLRQLVFRPVTGTARRGTAQVVEMGTITTVGGCDAGTVPYGSPTDEGVTTNLLDMTLRASTADLVPGARLAGMSETAAPSPIYAAWQLVDDVVTFDAADVRFDRSADAVPVSTSNGWFVLGLPGFERGYTRISRNPSTGIEVWLLAGWAAGSPTDVHMKLMVTPNAAAGFGTRNQTAHSWLEGIFQGQDPLPYFDLYTDFTGAFINRSAVDGSVESTMPARWQFVGANVQIQRSYDFTDSYRQRTWVPLANYGRNHFVMENEDLYDAAGDFVSIRISPRVNYYVDEGKAVKPAAAVAAKALSRPRVLRGSAER